MITALLVTLGGALGTLARYLLTVATTPISQHVPWGTIGINVSGSFLIGFWATLTMANGRLPLSEDARLFVTAGFCGGFTTFSAFSLQTLELIRMGGFGRAAANVAVSVLACLSAVAAGQMAAR